MSEIKINKISTKAFLRCHRCMKDYPISEIKIPYYCPKCWEKGKSINDSKYLAGCGTLFSIIED